MAKQFIGTDMVTADRMAEIFSMVNKGVPVLLNVKEVSKILGVSVSYLNKNRQIGVGPAYKKIGKRVLYPLDIVMAYQDTPLHNVSVIHADLS